MEVVPKNDFLKLNPDTVQFLRKQYNLENLDRLNESIDILEEWIKIQEHFVKKQMSRVYLERAIILGKGSVEKVKKKLDNLCTYRSLQPRYFEIFDADKFLNTKTLIDSMLSNLTEDHYRVYILRNVGKIDADLTNYYKCFVAMIEYIHLHDYCNGIMAIVDYTDADVMGLLKTLNIIEFQMLIKIVVEGFGMRVKGIHLISPSKFINVLVTLFKKAAVSKIAERIYSHQTLDSLHEHISKDILPSNYGGKEKSIEELHVDFVNALSNNEFTDYLEEIRNAGTNEELRDKAVFNEEFMGTPGSFRSMCLD